MRYDCGSLFTIKAIYLPSTSSFITTEGGYGVGLAKLFSNLGDATF